MCIPVHLNELSPTDVRGTFPGFAYQLGNLFAAFILDLPVSAYVDWLRFHEVGAEQRITLRMLTHGSWLNTAEIELAVLAGHPLKPRIGDPATLEREVSAWQETRNAQKVQIDWRFTTADARIKLKRLYPSIEVR